MTKNQRKRNDATYNTGDYVVCRSGGIWRVVCADADTVWLIAHENRNGETKALSVNGDKIVRKIVSEEEILEVIDRVGFICTIQASGDKIRNELYREAMAKFDEIEWVRVIKTVYLRQQEKQPTAAELTYSEKAKSYLHGEISVLLKTPADKVEEAIVSAVSGDTW